MKMSHYYISIWYPNPTPIWTVSQISRFLVWKASLSWLSKSIQNIQIGNFLIMSLVPVILLTVLNYLIYRRIHKATLLHNTVSAHHRRDNTMATLLTSIVVMFLFCHSTKLVTNTCEAYQMIRYGRLVNWPDWADVLSKWNHLMLAVNASINIIIYVIKVTWE